MEEANDLLQETILKAFTNRDKFADGTNLKGLVVHHNEEYFYYQLSANGKKKYLH